MRNWNKILQKKKHGRFCYSPEDTKNAVDVRIKFTIDTKQYQTAAINQVQHQIKHFAQYFTGRQISMIWNRHRSRYFLMTPQLVLNIFKLSSRRHC